MRKCKQSNHVFWIAKPGKKKVFNISYLMLFEHFWQREIEEEEWTIYSPQSPQKSDSKLMIFPHETPGIKIHILKGAWKSHFEPRRTPA